MPFWQRNPKHVVHANCPLCNHNIGATSALNMHMDLKQRTSLALKKYAFLILQRWQGLRSFHKEIWYSGLRLNLAEHSCRLLWKVGFLVMYTEQGVLLNCEIVWEQSCVLRAAVNWFTCFTVSGCLMTKCLGQSCLSKKAPTFEVYFNPLKLWVFGRPDIFSCAPIWFLFTCDVVPL